MKTGRRDAGKGSKRGRMLDLYNPPAKPLVSKKMSRLHDTQVLSDQSVF